VFSRTAIDAAVWTYSVFDGDTELPYHFELMVTDVCHDACAPIDTSSIQDGRWHHLALSWDLHYPAFLYLDGQFAQRVVVPVEPHPMIPGGVLFLGQESGAFSAYGGAFVDFDAPLGQLDNFRMHASALSAADVRTLMFLPAVYNGFVHSAALVASFTFDEGSVETTELPDGTTRIVTVFDTVSNLTMFGGCYLCETDTTLFPLITVSDCPVITTESTPFRYPPVTHSVDIFVPMLYSLTAPCDELDTLRFDVILHSESSVGEYFPLKASDAPYSGSIPVQMFNGTLFRRLDPSPVLGIDANTCELHGAGAVLFLTGSHPNATISYAVEARNFQAGTVLIANGTITLVQGSRVDVTESTEVQAAVSRKTQFQSGLLPLGA
jgi:Concanavalin A-like lectin/glucanases superfamily